MKVLVIVDFINDMVSESGKLAGKGYYEFAKGRNLDKAVANWRSAPDVDRVVHVGLQFRSDYADAARNSVLLGKAPEFGVAAEGSVGGEFVSWSQPSDDDIVIRKRRMSAFHGTDLDVVLSSLSATAVIVGGVATDLAVSSAARDAHDRDYEVEIAESMCVAANEADHEAALLHLSKIAVIR